MEETTPDSPLCPSCGGSDWFGDPRWDYALIVVKKGTIEPLWRGEEAFLPVEGFVCRACRFLRLRVVGGTLAYPDSEDEG